MKNSVLELAKTVNEDRRRYSASTELKGLILQAESIAVANIVESINTHSRVYLDLFFTDDPICVDLMPFKESKKAVVKPQINVEVNYKGMETDLSTLSGGELSRIVLAYTLALGEIFGTPLLMLDESTASLDQELSGAVFDGIRENFNGTMVLVIGHQLVEGSFDKVMKLG